MRSASQMRVQEIEDVGFPCAHRSEDEVVPSSRIEAERRIDFESVRFAQSLHLGSKRASRRSRVVVFRVDEECGRRHACDRGQQSLAKLNGLIPAAGAPTKDDQRADIRIPRRKEHTQGSPNEWPTTPMRRASTSSCTRSRARAAVASFISSCSRS